MLASDASLGQIALECGLSDQTHFTRLFHRFVGESSGRMTTRAGSQDLLHADGSRIGFAHNNRASPSLRIIGVSYPPDSLDSNRVLDTRIYGPRPFRIS